jgi:hypothetical protein
MTILRKIPPPLRCLACIDQLSAMHVASYDRVDGIFIVLALFGLIGVTARRAALAPAGPTTLKVTKGGETCRFIYRFAIQNLVQRGFVVPLNQRSVGSASAELQSGVQLWASLGISRHRECLSTRSPDLDKDSPRQNEEPCRTPMEAE